jgi:hypothetical protein
VYFYLRAQQLLRLGGVACFISSNKWLRASYGEALRQHLLDEQAFVLVVDFGELPVFQTAATFPAIFSWRKEKRAKTSTKWAVVKNLQECYDEGIAEHITRIAQILPASQFGKGKSRLVSTNTSGLQQQMKKTGIPLGDYVKGEIYRGVVTGLNEAFVIDQQTRERLIRRSKKSAEIIKPLLVGDDVRRYDVQFRSSYIIFSQRGIDIDNYPAIREHLELYRPDLTPKKTLAGKGRKPGDYKWFEIQDTVDYSPIFEMPKIIYPEIAKEPRFFLDLDKRYPIKTIFSIPIEDWYLLAILNSRDAWSYLKSICPVLGDEEKGGRLTLQEIYLEKLPIPNAPQNEREAVARLAKQAQKVHTQRRARIEKFLGLIGVDPAQSTSRNPLESPWLLSKDEFTRRAKAASLAVYTSAREETSALTEEIVRVEAEIDERVKALYGL